jgi:hypothetical protein
MKRPKSSLWVQDGKALTATMGDSTYRIVQYPDESPLGGKFGVYQDGRYQAALATLHGAKAHCAGMATKARAFNFARSK